MSHADSVFQKSIAMKDAENDYCIMKDLPRTLTFMKNFNIEPSSGENKLYNVLKAYACYDY